MYLPSPKIQQGTLELHHHRVAFFVDAHHVDERADAVGFVFHYDLRRDRPQVDFEQRVAHFLRVRAFGDFIRLLSVVQRLDPRAHLSVHVPAALHPVFHRARAARLPGAGFRKLVFRIKASLDEIREPPTPVEVTRRPAAFRDDGSEKRGVFLLPGSHARLRISTMILNTKLFIRRKRTQRRLAGFPFSPLYRRASFYEGDVWIKMFSRVFFEKGKSHSVYGNVVSHPMIEIRDVLWMTSAFYAPFEFFR